MMKTIPYVLLLPLALIVLFTQCKKDPEIELVDIPSPTLLNALIDVGVDIDGDGAISKSEADSVLILDFTHKGISDMTGIEVFINLEELYCHGNQLTNLDVSYNSALLNLDCSDNQLTHLDVSYNTGLLDLKCSWNPLTSLDISENPKMEILRCRMNLLTTLDVSNNKSLYYINCGWNQLTNLDVSNNSDLRFLFCQRNFLTTLDFSNNYTILELECGENQLTNLDLSQQSRLYELDCGCNDFLGPYCERSNPLISLDISKNVDLRFLRLMYLPTLSQVCVWELPFPPVGINVFFPDVDTTGSPNVYFTTECSE